jgi:hypothetical protein
MQGGDEMELKRLASGGCGEAGDCPTIYVTDGETVLVQGDLHDDHGLNLPVGEGAVAIPLALLVEAAQQVHR